jgi:hypothetical protein
LTISLDTPGCVQKLQAASHGTSCVFSESRMREICLSGSMTVLPPKVFVLAKGERLEARRLVLTANILSVSTDGQLRTVPLDMLDINTTVMSNHERGIDLQIPADRNEISL